MELCRRLTKCKGQGEGEGGKARQGRFLDGQTLSLTRTCCCGGAERGGGGATQCGAGLWPVLARPWPAPLSSGSWLLFSPGGLARRGCPEGCCPVQLEDTARHATTRGSAACLFSVTLRGLTQPALPTQLSAQPWRASTILRPAPRASELSSPRSALDRKAPSRYARLRAAAPARARVSSARPPRAPASGVSAWTSAQWSRAARGQAQGGRRAQARGRDLEMLQGKDSLSWLRELRLVKTWERTPTLVQVL